MKMFKKIALIILSIAGVLLIVTGLVVGYFYAFKLSNNSDIVPHKDVKWQLSIYPKNAVSPLIGTLYSGENAEDLRDVLSNLDSLSGERTNEIKGIAFGKPIHMFGDIYEGNELIGEIYPVSNRSDFESTYRYEEGNFKLFVQGNSICVIKSKELSKEQLDIYFKSKKWPSQEIKEKNLAQFDIQISTGERVTGALTYANNSISVKADLHLTESYRYVNKKGTSSINFGADEDGKANPILKLLDVPMVYLYHNYKGVNINLVDGQPIVAPVGPTLLKSSQIDSTWLRFKHPKLVATSGVDSKILDWRLNDKTLKPENDPMSIHLAGIDLLRIEGNPMLTAFLSMSPVVGDFMEIISNMEHIQASATSKGNKKLEITMQISYNPQYNFLSDLIIYIIKNQQKFKDLEALVNLQNK